MRTESAASGASGQSRVDRKSLALALFLCVGASALWFGRPAALRGLPQKLAGVQSCLSNQERIGLAFAQYMRDFDGKFPRGLDPEDRFNPRTWRSAYGGKYRRDVQTSPMLPDLLLPYLRTREIWRCPDDAGYKRSRLFSNEEPGLQNVFPSSFAKFGMSYSYLTKRGFDGMRARDFRDPGRNISLSDADWWHGTAARPSVNALFVDGHVQNLGVAQFTALTEEEW